MLFSVDNRGIGVLRLQFAGSAGVPPNAASYLHRDGILGVRKLACAFDWARPNGSNNLSVTPEGCSKLQHSKAPSAQKQKTCGIRRLAGRAKANRIVAQEKMFCITSMGHRFRQACRLPGAAGKAFLSFEHASRGRDKSGR
jgi:hypothetical protein